MERARIQFLFGDPDVDPDDPDVHSDLLAGDAGGDAWDPDEAGDLDGAWDLGDGAWSLADGIEDDDDWDDDGDDDYDGYDSDDGEDHLALVGAEVARLVVAQVAADDPPEVWATARRLLGLGLDRHEVFAQLRFACLEAIMAVAQAGAQAGAGDQEGAGDQAGAGDQEGAGGAQPAMDRYREALDALPLPSGAEIVGTVLAVVAEHQGATDDDVERLVVERLGSGHRPGAGDGPPRAGLTNLVEEVCSDLVESGALEYLPPDRLVHVGALTAGIVLTHRLTEAEVGLDVLVAGCDLAGFTRAGALRLPDGTEIDVFPADDDVAWQGPDGWLDAYRPGTVLAVRVAGDGTVDLAPLPADPAPDPALVARLRAAYDLEVAEPGLPVTVENLVLGLLAEDRHAFAEPRPPLAALCEAAGLERRGGRVAHDETVWRAGEESALVWRVYDRLEDDAARTALRILRSVGDGDPDPSWLRDTLAGLAQPGVAEVVLDEVIPGPGVDDGADGGLIDAVHAAATAWAERLLGAAVAPGEVALARWVAAVVAERCGDVLVADAHLALAVDADPGFAPALERAAWYASDRGDAARAVRLWRCLDAPDPQDLDIVAPFSRPAGGQPGRNEPCWCGSGRKYKTCHRGQAPVAPLPDRVGWLCRKATLYLHHAGPGGIATAVACATARAVDPDDPGSIAEALDDPIVIDAALTEGGWFERFVTDRGPLLPDDEALLAASWTLCPRTVYEIAEVTPGSGMSVVDLRTGDRLDVRERTFSRQARPGTLVCARAVPDGETHQFVGTVFLVAPGREAALLDLCDGGDPEEVCAWVRAMHLPPTLRTREDEPLVACRAVLAVDDPALAAKVLDHLYEAEGDGWVEMFDLGGERILRATLELDGNRLVVATHSEARLDRVLSAVRAELPGTAVISDARRPLRPGEMPEPPRLPGDDGGGGAPVALDPEEHAAVVAQIQEQMERRWLDEPVPALGHVTPRQAAADPTRRPQLERLLAGFPEPDPDSDFIGLRPGHLRAALGL